MIVLLLDHLEGALQLRVNRLGEGEFAFVAKRKLPIVS
jgi:hypothetical protein